MSLLDVTQIMLTVRKLKKTPDGYGGYISTWYDAFSFYGNMYVDNNVNEDVASRETAHDTFTLLTPRYISIDFHDVVRADSGKFSGKTYRLTTKTNEDFTPSTSTLDLAKYTMEEWAVPDD